MSAVEKDYNLDDICEIIRRRIKTLGDDILSKNREERREMFEEYIQLKRMLRIDIDIFCISGKPWVELCKEFKEDDHLGFYIENGDYDGYEITF